jgi:hypothetical protein
MKTVLLVLLALFATCGILTAQDGQSRDLESTPASKKSDQKPVPKPELQDATPVANTAGSAAARPSLLKEAGPGLVDDATRKAAHDLAKAPAGGSEARTGDQAKNTGAAKKDDSGAAPSEVGEFQPVTAGAHQGSAAPVMQKDQSPLKRIHGDVYGAGGGTGRAGSESVGGTSKSGKTSVYVESDQAASTAAPQR